MRRKIISLFTEFKFRDFCVCEYKAAIKLGFKSVRTEKRYTWESFIGIGLNTELFVKKSNFSKIVKLISKLKWR